MILSVSRRTDIPAFYSEWLYNRIQDGYVCTRNPYNHQVSRISLEPDDIDCMVFWTKNPIPMLPRLDELRNYIYYFQFTLTGYGRSIEPAVPDKKRDLIPAFQALAREIGPNRVIWRYDPILFTNVYTPGYHLNAFQQIAEALDGYTEKCVISFVDLYEKVQQNLSGLSIHTKDKAFLLSFAEQIQKIAAQHHITVASCAEKIDLSPVGIEHNACIDRRLIESLIGASLSVSKDLGQRPECLCASSIDIGTYNTCCHCCRYCYANARPDTIRINAQNYDPMSPILCDRLNPNDIVVDRSIRSLISC